MKKIKLLLTLSILFPLLSGCNGKSELFVTFHQEYADDVKIQFDSNTKQSEIEAQEPDIVKKEGYIGNWEEYNIENKTSSFTVNAIYSPIYYYVYFKAQGVLVEQVPFSIEDIHGDNSKLPAEREPECPSHPWSEAYWEDYSLSLQNIIVNAKYDRLKEFTVSFEANGDKIGHDITITKNDLDSEGQIRRDLIPQEVLDYKVEYHDVVWNFKLEEAKDTVIKADVSLHDYYVRFLDFEGEQYGDLVPYNIESTWESINKPAAPEIIGYTTFWKNTALSYSDDVIVEATPDKIGNEYVITFSDSSTQTVRYGDPYLLDNLSGAKEKWFDEEDNLIDNNGIWNIPNNVLLHKCAINEDKFESDLVPEFIDIEKSLNIKSVSISKGDGINGNNALKVEIKQGDFGLCIKQEYLDDVFSDDTESLNFYAKSTINNFNFRHRTNSINICYEVNNKNYLNGLTNDYKEFSFTKEMYLNHNEDNGDYMIYGGNPEDYKCDDSTLFISLFIFNESDIAKKSASYIGFENASLQCETDENGNVKKAHYRFAYFDGYEMKNDEFRIDNSSKPDEMYPTATFGFSNENLTEGRKSLSFTKPIGYIAFFLPQGFTSALRTSESQKFSFDMYSTVTINSNNNVKNLTDGNNQYLNYPNGLQHPADKWVTYTFDVSQIDSNLTARFLIIQGSTAGTYYFDNFRIISE